MPGAEAADVLIYLLLLFDRLGLDPSEEVMRKIDENEQRFPASEISGRARLKRA